MKELKVNLRLVQQYNKLSMQSSHLLEDLKSMLHLLWEYSGFNIAQTTELGDTVS